jgi:hypothetical protein
VKIGDLVKLNPIYGSKLLKKDSYGIILDTKTSGLPAFYVQWFDSPRPMWQEPRILKVVSDG